MLQNHLQSCYIVHWSYPDSKVIDVVLDIDTCIYYIKVKILKDEGGGFTDQAISIKLQRQQTIER